ncbi:hypothetical protein ACJMK2_005057 [Sinanodonta woodiana]|uniref:Uncharacterized protein n=1 Tax=Sinanodonta woodiana TaxID=1069815 RepID=A0ABD3VP77_SINWO
MSRTWTFLYNDWLAIDRGDVLSTVATLPAVSEEEFKQKRIHHFLLKSSQDLRDGHLWVSIFCKPARSTFTRAQRLTCGLSLLLTNMLTNIMFHGIPTDDPHAQVAVSGITISLTTIIIGIESSLIMFPINLVILQLFLRVAPKPKENTKSRRLSTLHQSKQSMMSVHGLKSKTGDMETTKEEQTQDEKNPQSSNAVKSPAKRLPWWFLYIAWILVLATALVSSYFVMLYGLKYGYVKSINWLVSFLTGFSQNAVVQQPLKVICVALVITLILKKSVGEEEYGYDEKLAEDEEYLHTIQGPKRKKHPALNPPSQHLMKKIRHRLHLEWFMNMILRDMVLYVVFLAILLFMVHGHRNVSQAYVTSEAIQNNFFHAGSKNEVKLDQVNTMETFYKYLENTVIPKMTVMGADDRRKDEPCSSLSEFHLVGPYRLRQLRVVLEPCEDEIEQLIKIISVPYCIQTYWIGNEDTNDYNGSWKNLLDDKAVKKVTPWIHQSAFKLNTIPFPAEHAIYSGGGYVIDMPKDLNSQLAHLRDIKNSDWIDDRTRAIFIEFTLFNSNVNLFSVVMMIVEFTNIGAMFPYSQVFTANLYHYGSSLEIFVAVCEVGFLLFTVLFTFIEYTRIRKIGKKKYFDDPWNYVEIAQIALSYIIIGLFFERMMSVKNVLKDYKNSRGNKFVSFYTAISWDFLLGNFMAFLVGLVILKAFKLLKFNKRMFMLADTVVMAKGSLGSFMMMTGIFFMAFGHFAMISFGKHVDGYIDLGTSLVTLINFALGVSDFAGLDAANRVLGPLFFFTFVFLAQWCFMTFFMGIIDLAISDARSKLEVRRNKYELLEYILRKLKENILHI